MIANFDNSSRAGTPSLLYDTKEELLAFREERPNNSVKMAIFAKRVSVKVKAKIIEKLKGPFSFEHRVKLKFKSIINKS